LAHNTFQGKGPGGQKEADRYNTLIKATGVKGYSVDPTDSIPDMKEELAAAQKEQSAQRSDKSAERVAGAPEAAQQRKDAHTMGYALDKDGNLSYMSKADADNIHSTFEEAKPSDVKADRQALRQLDEVQRNVSRYTKAAKDYANLPLSVRVADQANLHGLLNKAGVADFNAAISEGGDIKLPVLTSFLEGLSRQARTHDYEDLSPQGKALFDGYLNTLSAVPAYQKALTGVGRTNKEVMDLELATIANPTLDAKDIISKQGRFQENIDQASQGFPNNLPGIKTPKTVRGETEGGGAATGAAAKIHANFQDFAHIQSGPKGTAYSDDGKTWYDQNGKVIGGK
jgi:hypothetical protein